MGPGDQNPDGVGRGSLRTVTGHGQPAPELARELTWALAEQPQILVCDLTDMPVPVPDALRLFAPVVRYLADWPGTGVVVVSTPEAQVRKCLSSQPLPGTFLLSETRDVGVGELQALLPSLGRVGVQLQAQLTAPRAARAFTARSLLDWQLTSLISSACLVASELVTNAVIHAASTVDVTLSRADGRIQLTVRDHGAGHPTPRSHEPDDRHLNGRGLLLVQHIARGWGVFPAEAEGKTVWAVFDTP